MTISFQEIVFLDGENTKPLANAALPHDGYAAPAMVISESANI